MLNWFRKLFVSDVNYVSDNIVDLADSFDDVFAVYRNKSESDDVFYFLHTGRFNQDLEKAISDLDYKITHNTDIKCSLLSFPLMAISPDAPLGKPVYVKQSKSIESILG